MIAANDCKQERELVDGRDRPLRMYADERWFAWGWNEEVLCDLGVRPRSERKRIEATSAESRCR